MQTVKSGRQRSVVPQALSKKRCADCGAEFPATRRSRRFCLPRCRYRAAYVADRMKAGKAVLPRIAQDADPTCAWCFEIIAGPRPNKKFCCVEHRNQFANRKRHPRTNVKCLGCGKRMVRIRRNQKHHDDDCRSKAASLRRAQRVEATLEAASRAKPRRGQFLEACKPLSNP